MDFVASYLLCVENKMEPSKANIMKLLQAVAANVNESELDAFVSKISEKSYEEILSTGSAMMVLKNAGPVGSAAPAAASSATQAAAEESEASEESDDMMDFF